MRLWYQKNKEKVKKWSNRYYYSNHISNLHKQKEYREKHPIKVRRAIRNWATKFPERKQLSNKKYRETNHEILVIKKREEYKSNKKQYQKSKKNYYKLNKERILQASNIYYHSIKDKIRFEVLSYYSNGIPKCSCCGYSEIQFLTIDHINGRSNEIKRKTGINLIRHLKKNDYPEGFQVLCYNCNCSKGFFGQCGHKFQWVPNEKRRRFKLQFLNAYSSNTPSCACCGETNIAFLSIDHIDGDNTNDYDSKGRKLTGNRLYHKLKKLGFPKGYQVLCYNCNCAKGNNHLCPHKLKNK